MTSSFRITPAAPAAPAAAAAPAAPIACSLSQDGLAKILWRWHSLAERAITGVTQTPRGMRLSFGARPGVEAELRDLARAEQGCCAFADWTVHATDETVVLEVSGPSPAAVAAVHEMFATIRALLDSRLDAAPCSSEGEHRSQM